MYKTFIGNQYKNLTKQFNELTKSSNPSHTISIVDEEFLDIVSNKEKHRKILTAKYQLLGSYDKHCGIFHSARHVDTLDKKSVILSKYIRNYSSKLKEIIINKEYSDVEYIDRILYYVENYMCVIRENNVLDFIEFCVVITESQGYVSYDNGESVKYYLITDIVGT